MTIPAVVSKGNELVTMLQNLQQGNHGERDGGKRQRNAIPNQLRLTYAYQA